VEGGAELAVGSIVTNQGMLASFVALSAAERREHGCNDTEIRQSLLGAAQDFAAERALATGGETLEVRAEFLATVRGSVSV
jgi:hypothetical protein